MRNAFRHQLGMALTAVVVGTGTLAGQQVKPNPSSEATTLRAQVRTRSNLVALEEIRSVEPGYTAFEAVRRLRPEYLNRHATPVASDVEGGFAVVYLDGVRIGGPRTLETIAAAAVREIRFLKSTAAAEELGRNHRGGVILVSTIR